MSRLFLFSCVATALWIASHCFSCPDTVSRNKREKASNEVKSSIKKAFSVDDSLSGREVYNKVATQLKREKSDEDYFLYLDAVNEIANAAFRFCANADLSKLTKEDIATLIGAFKAKVSEQDIHDARNLYGSLLCIRDSGTSKSRSKRQNPDISELEAFFNSLGGEILERVIFYYDDDEYPNHLAFVIDTTGSMGDEIEAVKKIIRHFIKNEGREPQKYVLATFSDPISCKVNFCGISMHS